MDEYAVCTHSHDTNNWKRIAIMLSTNSTAILPYLTHITPLMTSLSRTLHAAKAIGTNQSTPCPPRKPPTSMSRTRPIHGKQMVSPAPLVIISDSTKHRQNHPPVPAAQQSRLHQNLARLKKKRHVYMYHQRPIRAVHPSFSYPLLVSLTCCFREGAPESPAIEHQYRDPKTNNVERERRSSMPVYFAKNA